MDVDMRALNHITWDEYYMGIALLASKRSKDQNTPSGACIVNKHNQVVGIGWNGMPFGISDNDLPWNRCINGADADLKYKYVVPAVCNAYFHRTQADLKECKLYATLFPTNECAKIITQSGINEVIYISGVLKDRETEMVAEIIMKKSDIILRKFISSQKVTINFNNVGLNL